MYLLSSAGMFNSTKTQFSQVGDSEEDVERRKAQLYFLTQYWAFYAPYKVMFSFPSERTVVRRERSSGWYSLSAYYVGKCVVEVPMISIYPVLMVCVVYWVSGMVNASSFVMTLTIIATTVVEFNALGTMIFKCHLSSETSNFSL